MDPLQYASAEQRHPDALAFSALPDAPVVLPDERTPRAAAVRLHVARSLHRLADAVAPAPQRGRGAYARG